MRKIYTLTEMQSLVPEMGRFMGEKIDPINTANMLTVVDEWAAKNGYRLFQILTPPGAPGMFIFDVVAEVSVENAREIIEEYRKDG